MQLHSFVDNFFLFSKNELFFWFLRIKLTTRHLCPCSKQRTGRRQHISEKIFYVTQKTPLKFSWICQLFNPHWFWNQQCSACQQFADPWDINNSRYPEVFSRELPIQALFFQPFQCFIFLFYFIIIPPSLPSSPGVFLGFIIQHK